MLLQDLGVLAVAAIPGRTGWRAEDATIGSPLEIRSVSVFFVVFYLYFGWVIHVSKFAGS